MRRRLSMLLVLSLVLISMMTACFMGCTKAPKAFKGVDLKDPDEVVERLQDIIKDKNFTVVRKYRYVSKDDSYNRTYDISLVVTEDAFLCEKEFVINDYVQNKGKGIIEKVKNDVKFYEYNEEDSKWYCELSEDSDYSSMLEEEEERNLLFLSMEDFDLEYNKKDKIFEGDAKVGDTRCDITIEVTKEAIIITMESDDGDGNIKEVETYTELGTSEVDMPKGAIEKV